MAYARNSIILQCSCSHVCHLNLTQVAVMAIFFHKSAAQPALAAEGLLAAVSGLVLSLDGLRLSIKPMAVKCALKLPSIAHSCSQSSSQWQDLC
jgi:hypothetical protein